MSERYTKLFSLQPNLYSEEVPVFISAGALSKDNQTGKVFIQLRLQNIDSKFRSMVALKVAINTYDPAGKELETQKEYQYLDLTANRGAEFGEKQAIYLDNPSARKFDVSILEAVFSEGAPWIGEKQEWISLGKQKTLEESLGAELAEQYRRDTFPDAKYELTTTKGLWLCACGALNPIGEGNCCYCRNDEDTLLKAWDHTSLADHLHIWKEKTSQQKEVEKKKSTQKIALIIATICVLIIGVFFTTNGSLSTSKLKGTWQEAGYQTEKGFFVTQIEFLDNAGCYRRYYYDGILSKEKVLSYDVEKNSVTVNYSDGYQTFEYRNGKLIGEGYGGSDSHPDLIYSKIK